MKGQNLVQKWNNKLSALRRYLRGWEAHNNGHYKAQKQNLITSINELDLAADIRDLSEAEGDNLALAQDQLAQLLREEEIK